MMMTKKLFKPTNIVEKLKDANKSNASFMETVNHLISIPTGVNNFDLDKLATANIFHIDNIKNTCIDYRLRFLDLKYFKNDLPQEAFDKIARLEAVHGTTLSGFKIMAPSKLFRLKNTDDPLLFVPIGNDYFYLIHQWGDDLSPFRKLFMWPFKNIWNLMVLIMGISWIATSLTPMAIFSKTTSWSTYWMVYFFMFKAIAAIVLFYGFALGKNFNPAIWNSKYNKA
ncbi:hypothetical protein OAP39_04620 [Flavobacteriaceae bacterium]|nr:hypothetical protein [Flavobacteriaceae bacterium]